MKRVPPSHFALILIILGAWYLRLKGLTFQSYWHDELISAWRSNPTRSMREVIELTTWIHPPLHQLMLWQWYALLGYNEYVGRLLSAAIGVLGVSSIYLLGKELGGKRTGLVASLITALNIYHLYYSQEVRQYSLLFLTATLSYLYLTKTLRTRTTSNLVLYIICTTLMVYTHYYGLVLFATQAAFIMLHLLTVEKHRRKIFRQGIIAGVLILTLYSPTFIYILRQLERPRRVAVSPSPDFFIKFFKIYIENPYLITLFTTLLLVAFGILIFSNDTKRKQAVTLLYGWVLIFYMGAYVGLKVAADYPHLTGRYTIGVLPALIVLVAMGWEAMKDNTFKAILIISIIVMSLTHLFVDTRYYSTVTKQQWREITQKIIARDDSLPLYGWKRSSVKFYNVYLQQFGSERRVVPVGQLRDDPEDLSCFWLLDAHGKLFIETGETDQYPIFEIERLTGLEAVAVKYATSEGGCQE